MDVAQEFVVGAGAVALRVDVDQTAHPIVVDGCFGWLHNTPDSVGGDVAVLICPPLLRDALDSHYALRLLADAFAAAGYPAMRIDYPGTGDSRDLDANHWLTWRQTVHTSVDWLRAATGARRVVLCGLRIGATLGCLTAAERDDVTGLILLAPVLRGSSYLTQLRIESKFRDKAARPNLEAQERALDIELAGPGAPSAPGDGRFEIQELKLDAETVELIRGVDLRTTKLTSQHIKLCLPVVTNVSKDCVTNWSRLGAKMECSDFQGLGPLLSHNEQGEGRPADFSGIIAWLQTVIPPVPVAMLSRRLSMPRLSAPGWVETPMRFGPAGRLFGMLCEPEHQPGETAVLVVNAGRDPHYGDGRFGVVFARSLAESGIASLRIDFTGFGDSPGAPGKEAVLSAIFDDDREQDIQAAIDLLVSRGYRRFVVQGVCAGAYHALRGALADPRVGTLVLINLPSFTWRKGDTIEFLNQVTSKPTRYIGLLLNRATWDGLFHGKIDIRGVLRGQCERFCHVVRDRVIRMVEQVLRTHPISAPRRVMATLAARDARTLFLVAPNDRGMDILEHDFGRGAQGLQAFSGAHIRIVPEMNHSVNDPFIQKIIIGLIVNFLSQADMVPQRHSEAKGTTEILRRWRKTRRPSHPHSG